MVLEEKGRAYTRNTVYTRHFRSIVATLEGYERRLKAIQRTSEANQETSATQRVHVMMFGSEKVVFVLHSWTRNVSHKQRPEKSGYSDVTQWLRCRTPHGGDN